MKQFYGILIPFLFLFLQSCQKPIPKHRIIVSTDIGGSDPDDYQSLVHLFLYADTLEVVGLVSSPPHQGRREHILETIAVYEKDFRKLSEQSDHYPSPEYLRTISVQGAIEPQKAVLPKSLISEGAQLIINEAKKNDIRPLHILIWGSITDLAQALHKAPEIKSKVRAYYIGSWNTVQDSLARDYVYSEHPDLWLIENNSTFRGMYMGGYQEGDYDNENFVRSAIKSFGAMGDFFYHKKVDIKMGDTPSVLYLLNGDPSNPESESWGGRFQRTTHGPNYWTDLRDSSLIENGQFGAKTVNKWRKQYLDDWRRRMEHLK
ncbi:MAG: hypothetical protein ACI9IP_002020 [Arcticibacterium sp.]|jgi:hypothetical protein